MWLRIYDASFSHWMNQVAVKNWTALCDYNQLQEEARFINDI